MTISTQALNDLHFNMQTTSQFPQHFHSFGYTSIKQIDNMLPCVFSVIDHRRRQNVVRTLVLLPCLPLFCSYHILTSSVIYYWTDTRQIKHEKGVFYCFANKEAPAVYYTVTKHSGHLKRLACGSYFLHFLRALKCPSCFNTV